MNPHPAALFLHTAAKRTLAQAVEALQSAGASQGIALLYEPSRCRLARLSGERFLTGPDGGPIETARVFEARLFSTEMELRWLNDPSGRGEHRAVILAESDRSGRLGLPWSVRSQAVLGTFDQTYLLWGEGTGKQPATGWSILATSRIGALPVPLAGVERNQRVLLHTREYLAEYEHGNAAVCDERLLSLGKEVSDG